MVGLERLEWRVGAGLGAGGFGRVYLAESKEEPQAVVKFVPKARGASRELLFEDLEDIPNVVPVLDRGEWDDCWVIAMPRAEKSLRDHLGRAGGRLCVDAAVRVLVDVAEALVAIEDSVVHRDIKPDNVLLLDGRWCLADFGISRYAEATTAEDTRKHAMTGPYAAPEQWRGERATSATDVYATGVVAYELLAGRRPFIGPDYRSQHLGDEPEPIQGIPPQLGSLVTECLYKGSEARPRPRNLLARLQGSVRPASEAAQKLQQAQALVVKQRAEENRQRSVARTEEERRAELFEAAEHSLTHVGAVLRDRILENAPASEQAGGAFPQSWSLSLNGAELSLESVQRAPSQPSDVGYDSALEDGCLREHHPPCPAWPFWI